MNKDPKYYVYVYIDPRNFEEFYYGKGKGSRKESHLSSTSDTEKTKRIAAIKKEGLEPIIKVIAANLTEDEAFLIEKTLIWKLGRTLTNISSGHFSEKFRPHNTFYKNLSGFDYRNGIYYLNVGQGKHRLWDDCKKYGFLSAGQGKKWRDQILTLNVGDAVIPFLKGHGYVGIGIVKEVAVRARDFLLNGKHLSEIKELKSKNMLENSENAEKSEYLLKVNWVVSVDAKDAKWKKKSGLFSTQLVKASLDNQPKTVEFLESEFKIKFSTLLS